MKKLISILLCVLTLVSVLAGCGATEEVTEQVETVVEDVTEETTEALPYEGVELVFWNSYYEGTPEAVVMQELADEFKAKTGATIKLEFKGNERRQIMPTALESGEKIDMFQATYYEIDSLVNYMADLAPYYEAIDYESFTYPVMIKDMVDRIGWKGVAYGASMNTLWYDQDAFAAAGVTEIPVTMEEFAAACDKLVANGVAPIALDSAYISNYWGQHIQRFIGQATAKELSWNGGWSESEGAIAAAQTIIDWVNAGYFADGAPDIYPTSQNKIALGQAAMVYCGTWVGKEIEDAMGTDINWACMAYPIYDETIEPNVNSAYSGYLHVNKNCEYPELAFEWLLTIATGEGDKRRIEVTGTLPGDPNNAPPADFEGSVEYLSSVEVCLDVACAVANTDMKVALVEVITNLYSGVYATGLEAMQAMDALYA